MLSACAASVSKRAATTPDPVIVTRTETRTICPPELRLPLGARPVPDADARIDGNPAGMVWLQAILSRLGLVEDRLTDAAKECAAAAPEGSH